MQNVHYFIVVFGWLDGGIGGISPLEVLFRHFHFLY